MVPFFLLRPEFHSDTVDELKPNGKPYCAGIAHDRGTFDLHNYAADRPPVSPLATKFGMQPCVEDSRINLGPTLLQSALLPHSLKEWRREVVWMKFETGKIPT